MDKDELWRKYKETGSIDIRSELIVQYIRLVQIIAYNLRIDYKNSVEYDVLVSLGVIGLIDAIVKFNPDKGAKFETYANIRIRGSIIDQLRDYEWAPRGAKKDVKMLQEATDSFVKLHGRNPSEAEICDLLGITLDKLYKTHSHCVKNNIVSVEDEMHSFLRIENKYLEYNPEQSCLLNEVRNEVAIALNKLSERERTIIKLYHYERLTYKEISEVIGVSESRISQIIKESMKKLKIYLNNTR